MSKLLNRFIVPRLGMVMAAAGFAVTVNTLGQSNFRPSGQTTLRERGAEFFASSFTPKQGLGPLYNGVSCISCHISPTIGGMGPNGLGVVIRVGRLTSTGFDAMIDGGGPVSRAHSVAELGMSCDLDPGIPAGATMTSVRNAPDLHGTGLIDEISERDIVAGAVSRGGLVHGRVHTIVSADGVMRIGRFGWKAETATLKGFIAEAFRNELGITSPLAPDERLPIKRQNRNRCPGEGAAIEDDGNIVDSVTAFVASLPPPPVHRMSAQEATLFEGAGCGACHTASLPAGKQRAWLYSDLLLHDLGSDLDDKVVQSQAGGRDWRTTPLWGVGKRLRLLHDGRAYTIREAILAHGGEAEEAKRHFLLLSQTDRDSLLTFLAGL